MSRKEELVKELAFPVEEAAQLETENQEAPLISRYGKVWLKWLQNTHPLEMEELELNGRLQTMVQKKDQEGRELEERILDQLIKSQPMPEDYLEQVQQMNILRLQARELAMAEIIPAS